MNEFQIDVTWLPPIHGPAEIGQTSAALQIMVGGKNATRVEDEWSKSVQSNVRVSAYPLALWIASSWWRLRWEPLPFRTEVADVSWRLAHEMPAAGFGFLWPLLRFDSDGSSIGVDCRSNSTSQEPVRYLTSFHEIIPAATFENTLEDFVALVIARLSMLDVTGTALQQLWSELREERSDPGLTWVRKMEALLGYDPDEAPEQILTRLERLSAIAGVAAVDEIAPVCAGSPLATLDGIEGLATLGGLEAHPTQTAFVSSGTMGKPWEVGWELARQVRKQLGLNGGPVSDENLANLLGFPSAMFPKPTAGGDRPPLSLAIRDSSKRTLTLLFRKRNKPALRFEAARFLCDHIMTPPHESWLPATDSSTNRQKTQRAFAAELLCPVDGLRAFLDSDLSQEAIEEAAEHFSVSEGAVESVLVNHGDIPAGRMTI